MKKILIFILVLLLTGCKSNYKTCTINLTNDSMNYEFNAKYKIYYKNKYVKKIVKDETYIFNDRDSFKTLKETKNLEYSMMNNSYGGYDYKITESHNKLKIKATINTNDLDIKKLVKDNMIDKYYTSKNEILLSGLIKYYENKSAICN